jgi:hypothetical protein
MKEHTLDDIQKELNNKQYDIEGGKLNFVKRLRDVVKGVRKDKFPPDERKWLEENGDKQIEGITIFRRPVNSAIDKALDFISMGKWSSVKNKYGFDTFFHLGMVCDYDGGKKVLIDKTGTLNIKEVDGLPSGVETISPDIPNNVSFNEMINGAKRILGVERFYRYDSFKSNCQMFVMALLKSARVDSPKIRDFVFQDITELVKEMPKYVNSIANALTNASGVADVLVRGEGFYEPHPPEFDRPHMNSVGVQKYLTIGDRKVNSYQNLTQQRKSLVSR